MSATQWWLQYSYFSCELKNYWHTYFFFFYIPNFKTEGPIPALERIMPSHFYTLEEIRINLISKHCLGKCWVPSTPMNFNRKFRCLRHAFLKGHLFMCLLVNMDLAPNLTHPLKISYQSHTCSLWKIWDKNLGLFTSLSWLINTLSNINTKYFNTLYFSPPPVFSLKQNQINIISPFISPRKQKNSEN